jgi:transcriptional regulator with XRE-family HTH domain
MKYTFEADYFRTFVRVWRKMNDLNTRDMAELSGLAPANFNRIEQGDKCPDIAEFLHLCYVMDESPHGFFKEKK